MFTSVALLLCCLSAYSGPDASPVFQVPITDQSGKAIGTLAVMAGESGAGAVDQFCSTNGLTEDYCTQLLYALCNREGFPCKVMATLTVNDKKGGVQGTVVIYEGESATHTINAYCQKYDWG